jgi:hypothetical protein
MADTVDFKLTGFEKLQDMLDPGEFPERLRATVRKATMKVGLVAEGAIKTAITNGDFVKNRPMTVALKGSDRPLVDSGELLKAITSEVEDWDRVVVGVIKDQTVQGKDGKPDSIKSIAGILAHGATIKVTPEMRGFFAAQARRFQRGEIKRPWRPLSPDTKLIVIKKRPFLQRALRKRHVTRYERIWAEAIQRAMGGKR